MAPKKSKKNRRKSSKGKPEQKSWKCLQCDKEFKSENSMISHQKSKNHSNLTVECPECHEKCKDLDHLNRHIETSGHKTRTPRTSVSAPSSARKEKKKASPRASTKKAPAKAPGPAVIRYDTARESASGLRVTAKPYVPLFDPAAYGRTQTRRASRESISATAAGIKLGRRPSDEEKAEEAPPFPGSPLPGSVRDTLVGRSAAESMGSRVLAPREPIKRVQVDLPNLDAPAPPINYEIGNGWTVFWNPPTSLNHSTHNTDYLKSLREICDFQGVTNFWDKIKSLQKPSRVKNGAHNLMAFRKGLVPAWESFPYGGCWIINFHRWEEACKQIDALWETVLFGLASEAFGTPEVVGASIHIRTRGYRVCIWNRDNRVGDVRFAIADKLRMLLSIHPRKEIKYKYFSMSLADGSTTSQATPYQFIKVTF